MFATAQDSNKATDHSKTNIQVAGVDEADLVKSDGEYLYVTTGEAVYILKAFPPSEAEIVSKIALNGNYSNEIYINGNMLVVMGSGYSLYLTSTSMPGIRSSDGLIESKMYMPYYQNTAFVKVYDISNKSNPVLVKDVFVNGSIAGSRMVGDYVYVVANKPAAVYLNSEVTVQLPGYVCNNITTEVQATDVKYADAAADYYNFITILAINIMDASQQPSAETFLAGSTSTMYVSAENMYLVVQTSYFRPMIASTSVWKEETLIYRIHFSENTLSVDASGLVPGHILNQYSMDEHEGNFRIATTQWTSNGTINGIYVLNMKLETVGQIEDIAPGETIYSARFLGDRCYLVTFRQIDPFYVIDLSNPTGPKILGLLKIPGFSGYLHPFDANHIIGIGKERDAVKLSLFDVSNVSAPKEDSKYVINYTYTYTEVLSDAKAFLFDGQRGLLALPVSWNSYKNGYQEWEYSQGAFIFNLTLSDGFVLKGMINHQANQSQSSYELTVRRILYMDNVLYTVSNQKVKMNDLNTLAFINELQIS